MSLPSVALVLRTSKTGPTGEAPVWLRASHARRSSFYTATGVAVKPKDWNDNKSEVRGSHPLEKAYNEKLSDLVAKAKAAALHAATAADVTEALKGKGRGSLSSFLDGYIALLEREGKVWEQKKYQTLRTKLQASLGWPLTWSTLTPDRLSVFETYLRRINGTNTVRKELSRLRQVVRRAIREGELEAGANPFARYQLPKSSPVERRRLTPAEVAALLSVGEAEGVAVGSTLAAVRDLFALQYYGAGVRVSDALQLTAASVKADAAGARLEYRMMKTDHVQSVRIPPPLAPIAARLVAAVEARDATARRRFGSHLVPLLKPGDDSDPVGIRRRIASATAVVNPGLKELATLAGVEPDGLSSHVARHSFADFARQAGDLFAVSKALGHSNLATTQAYLASFDRAAVDRLTDSMWTDDNH